METEGIFTNRMHDRNYWKKDSETGSTLSLKDGLFVLELHGKPYERGLAHGKLLHDEIKNSNICAYYGDFLRGLFDSSDLAQKIPKQARKTVGNILEWFYYSPLEQMCLQETKEEMYGICDAMGWEGNQKKQALRAMFAPDIMEHLAAGHLKGGKESLGHYYRGGCSAAYAQGEALRDNSSALLARNLDFPGVFVWKHPTVIFSYPEEKLAIFEDGKMKPTEKTKQPYAYISTAGFPGFGLTGLNASGLAMSTFVCLSKNYSKIGMSTLDFNHYWLIHAESMEDIKKMAGDSGLKCMSPHVLLFADGEKALSVEVDSIHKKIMPSSGDGLYVQTNHFHHPTLKKKEIMFPLEQDFTVGRYNIIKKSLTEEKNYGNLDLRRMIDIISCHTNLSEGNAALVGDFPAQPNTLTSVVFKLYGKAGERFDSKRNELWVAGGKPPAVCYNPYFKLGFNSDFTWDKHAWGKVERSWWPVVEGTVSGPVTPDMKKSLVYLMLSQEHLKLGEMNPALKNIEEAIKHFDDPGYKYIKAILDMKNGDLNDAYKQFIYLKKNHSFGPAKDSALSLWIGRCYDVLGKRDEAIACYEKILHKNSLSQHFKKAASNSIKKPFSLAQMPSSIDYFLMGPLEFY